MTKSRLFSTMFAASFSIGVALTGSHAQATLFEATGFADVSTAFANMRIALGDPLNGNAPGPLTQGRRQINWDAAIVPFDMPRDFFNNPAFPPTRGLVMTTASNEFRVSNDGFDNEFDTFNLDHPNQFTTFSSPRLFSPFDTNVLEINFFTPASNTRATVSGFGAVFTDVDLADTTMIEWFDVRGDLIDARFVGQDPQGLSFLGGIFDDPVAQVRITLGTATLASGDPDNPGNGDDVVVLDDFIFGEPQAVTEPATFWLMALGLVGLGLAAHRRRKH